jgi:hypothetical protein
MTYPRASLGTAYSLAATIALGSGACGACGKAPPEITNEAAAPADGGATDAPARRPDRHPRDDAGHLIPHGKPPPDDPDATPPQPKREPDWDLDSDDAARDYVHRYAIATQRYGETLDCIDVRPSQTFGDKRRVEVRVSSGCPDVGALRDVFLVDVGGDRLTVDDKSLRAPLALWPDGSDAEGPPGKVLEADDLRKPRDNVTAALRQMQLVPIRVQFYGRGSYPVVTLAGWHAAVLPTASEEDLRPTAEALCKATHDMPLAFFGGIDRSRILRIRCPGGARWDRL